MENKLGKELKDARITAGFSQEYMANELLIGRRTVINWENGISVPNLYQTIDWFKITNQNPMTRLYSYIYPEIDDVEKGNDKDAINETLTTMIEDLPTTVKKMIIFLLHGTESSSPYAVINMAVAHAHCQMFSRVNHAITIFNDYKMYEMSNKLAYKNEIMPDIDMLGKSIKYGIEATMKTV